jgi:hypothetical protein
LFKIRPSISIANAARKPLLSSKIPVAAGEPQADPDAKQWHITSEILPPPRTDRTRWPRLKAKSIEKDDAGERIELPEGTLTIIQDPNDPAWRIFTFIGEIGGAPLTQIDRLPAVRKDPLRTKGFDTNKYPVEFKIPHLKKGPKSGKIHIWTRVSDTLYKCKCGVLEWRPVGIMYELRADNHELYNRRTIRQYGPLIKAGLNDKEAVLRWNKYASDKKMQAKNKHPELIRQSTWQMAELEIVAECLNKNRDTHWSSGYDSAVEKAYGDLGRYRDSVVAPRIKPKVRTLHGVLRLLQRVYIQRELRPTMDLTAKELYLRLQEENLMRTELRRIRRAGKT